MTFLNCRPTTPGVRTTLGCEDVRPRLSADDPWSETELRGPWTEEPPF